MRGAGACQRQGEGRGRKRERREEKGRRPRRGEGRTGTPKGDSLETSVSPFPLSMHLLVYWNKLFFGYGFGFGAGLFTLGSEKTLGTVRKVEFNNFSGLRLETSAPEIGAAVLAVTDVPEFVSFPHPERDTGHIIFAGFAGLGGRLFIAFLEMEGRLFSSLLQYLEVCYNKTGNQFSGAVVDILYSFNFDKRQGIPLIIPGKVRPAHETRNVFST